MLLNTLLMNLQGALPEVAESAENLEFSPLNDDMGEVESAFSELLARFGLSTEDGIDEQKLTEILRGFADQTGEMLPSAAAAVPPDDLLAMEGDQLLAFLMANAGKEMSPLVEADIQALPEPSIPAQIIIDPAALAGDEPLQTEPLILADTALVPAVNELGEDGLQGLPAGTGLEPVPIMAAVADMKAAAAQNDILPEAYEGLSASTEHEALLTPLSEAPNSTEELPAQVSEEDSAKLPATSPPEWLEDSDSVEPLGEDSIAFDDTPSDTVKVAGEVTAPPADVAESVPANTPMAGQESMVAVDRTTATQVTSAADAAAVSAAGAVVIGEIKNQPRESGLSGVSGITATDVTKATDASVNEQLQQAMQTRLAGTEPRSKDPDALMRETLNPQPQSEAEIIDSDVELERPNTVTSLAHSQRAGERSTTSLGAAALLADQLNRPVRLASGGNALAERIATMVSHDIKQAVIQLDPAELGHIEVRLNVYNDQTQVQIVAPNQQTRDALEQQAARLREALGTQGLDLAQLDVADQSSQGFEGNSQGQEGQAAGVSEQEQDASETPVMVNQTIGLVDHFV